MTNNKINCPKCDKEIKAKVCDCVHDQCPNCFGVGFIAECKECSWIWDGKIMSQKTINIELLSAIENFVDAKLAQDWATRQKPFSHGLFEESKKLVAQRKDELHTRIYQLTCGASSR
jgi:RecJ-like exonuclease